MEIAELKASLEKEKGRLLQAKEFMESFYKQIYHSILNLRDTLFDHSFPTDSDWKNLLASSITEFNFPDFQLISTEGKIQNNSDFCINVLNNIQAIITYYLSILDSFSLLDIERIKTANSYIWDFIQRLYAKENIVFLTGQRLEVANSIKNNIRERLENNIAPFFNYLEQILYDEYATVLRPELQKIVGVYSNYMTDPVYYDKIIKQRCAEMNFEYNQELILNIISNLSKDQNVFINEIRAKYQTEEIADQKKNVFRLKEIAARFVSQAANIHKLENFLIDVLTLFQPISFFKRIYNFLRKMIVGKETKKIKKDFIFHYSSRIGKLEQKQTTISSLLKDLQAFKNFLTKLKGTLDFYSYTKSSTTITTKELENIIDNCITELTRIYEECAGLKEWLIGNKNQKNLSKLPVSRQEEFNDLLLALNYTLIINKQHMRDLDKHTK